MSKPQINRERPTRGGVVVVYEHHPLFGTIRHYVVSGKRRASKKKGRR